MAVDAGHSGSSPRRVGVCGMGSIGLVHLRALAAETPGRVHAVAYQNRFFPMVEEARRRVQAGELGALYLIHGHYLQDWLLQPSDSPKRPSGSWPPSTGGFASPLFPPPIPPSRTASTPWIWWQRCSPRQRGAWVTVPWREG